MLTRAIMQSEAAQVVAQVSGQDNNQKDIDKEDYSKDFVLKTYNLLNKNYSFQYLFSRLRDDRNVQATLAELENGEDYIEQIDQFAHNVNFAIH